MRRDSKLLQGAALLASIGGVQAGLNLNSSSNIVVYWGRVSESTNMTGLTWYCDGQDKTHCKELVARRNSHWLTIATVSTSTTLDTNQR